MIIKKEILLKCRYCQSLFTVRTYEGVGGYWGEARPCPKRRWGRPCITRKRLPDNPDPVRVKT